MNYPRSFSDKNIVNKVLLFGMLCLIIHACSPSKKTTKTAIARLGTNMLYKSELPSSIFINKQIDSIGLRFYILDWAKRQILLQKSLLNIDEKKTDIEKMVQHYRENLLINTYKDALVKKSIDTIVNKKEAIAYYEKHKNIFILNDHLIKYRMMKTTLKEAQNKNWYKLWKQSDYNPKVTKLLDSIASTSNPPISIKGDQFWVRYDYFVKHIPPISRFSSKNIKNLKGKFLSLKDKKHQYYIKIINYLPRGNTAPIRYVYPTIKKILLHERAKRIIDQLEKSLFKDAKKNKQFEIY